MTDRQSLDRGLGRIYGAHDSRNRWFIKEWCVSLGDSELLTGDGLNERYDFRDVDSLILFLKNIYLSAGSYVSLITFKLYRFVAANEAFV